MNWLIRRKPQYTDGTIDLYQTRRQYNDRELGFGCEHVWRITEHGKRQEIGELTYRPGEGTGIYYFGHIGYHIDPPWRGNHYAWRACSLIRDEIRRSGKSSVIITCDPDNYASRRTCEALGCLLERETAVDPELRRKYEISGRKIRYIWVV